MRKFTKITLISLVFLSGISKSFAGNYDNTDDFVFRITGKVTNFTACNSSWNDPCLDATLSAMQHVHALENHMIHWCFSTQSTSTGIVDCTSAVYQHANQLVNAMINNYVPCPSGNGSGIARL